MVIHFDSQEARLAYVTGKFEEIKPKVAENSTETAKSEKKSQKKALKSRKQTPREEKHDEVQAE